MGWQQSRSAAVDLAPSASESARFGHSVERLTVGAAWSDAMTQQQLTQRLDSLVAGSSATTIILRYPSEAAFVVKSLGPLNRDVYPAGTLLYWERQTAGAAPDPAVARLRHPLERSVADAALAVIADSFAGYVNHYHANPLIRETAVTEGYLEWAQSSLESEHNLAFAVRDGDDIAGVATVETASDHWDILLAGMAASAQGKGLYLRLITGVLAAAEAEGVDRMLISTQAHNIAVQRAWAKLGFRPVAAIETVHLVGRE